MERAEVQACWGSFLPYPSTALGCGCPCVPLPCRELKIPPLVRLERADPYCLPQL